MFGSVTVTPTPLHPGTQSEDPRPSRSALLSGWLSALLVAVLLLALPVSYLLSAATADTPASAPVIGTKETVRITGPDGESVEVLARVDTGATSTSIDEEIAEQLDLDLDDAETVTIVSSLGEDERPVVPVDLSIAGTSFRTEVNVADRSERSTQVLLGRSDLGRFSVSVGDELLTTPDSARAPSSVDSLLAQSSVLGPTALLAVLPLAALVVVVLRVVVGVATLGTFSSVLLAIGYSQAGLLPGLALTTVMFVLGFGLQPLLRRLMLPRVARLAALVGVVAIALVVLQEREGSGPAVDSWAAALPVVVTAVVVERLWEVWSQDGLTDAVTDAALTLGVAAMVSAIMLTPVVRALAETVPVELALICTALTVVVGRYQGLRVHELLRFRPQSRSGHTPARPGTVDA